MITITDSAVVKLKEILAEEQDPKMKVRMFVLGGGCSGFQYGFTLDDQGAQEDDWINHFCCRCLFNKNLPTFSIL